MLLAARFLRALRPDAYERMVDPLAPVAVDRPPDTLTDVFRYFLAPLKWLLVATLAASLIASLTELALFGFLGSLVDRMAAAGPESFLSEDAWLLAFMAFVLLVLRPVFTILSRALINLAIVPSLTTLVRWRSYRYVIRQSLGFFQNDFAGRISQKVMQTGMAVREAVVNVLDGVWYLIVYLIGTAVLMAGFDWRLLIPIVVWTAAYAVVIVKMVPPVRIRSAALSEANSGLSGRVVDGFTNIMSVKLFAHAEREESFGREAFERQLSASRALMRSVIGMMSTLVVLNSLLVFAMAVLSIWLWTGGDISLGAIAAANALTLRLNQISGWILRTVTALFENIGTIENGIETIAQPNSSLDRADAAPLAVGEGRIQFQNVTFRYGEGDRVVRDLSLAIRPCSRR